MNPAFLLPAVQRVISRIEIRYDHSLIALQKLSYDRGLPCFRQSEDNVPTVSEYPDVMIDATDAEPGLVDVNKRTFSQALHVEQFCSPIILGEGLNEIDDTCLRGRFVEQILRCQGDRPVWKAKDGPLINRPGPKAVPKGLLAELLNLGWFIIPLASRTVTFFAYILDH